MELLVLSNTNLWVEDEPVQEVVVIDRTGEFILQAGSRPHLRVLTNCVLYCSTYSGASTWCEIAHGVLSLSAEGRVLVTTRNAEIYSTSDLAGWRSAGS